MHGLTACKDNHGIIKGDYVQRVVIAVRRGDPTAKMETMNSSNNNNKKEEKKQENPEKKDNNEDNVVNPFAKSGLVRSPDQRNQPERQQQPPPQKQQRQQ